jgi:hypothetical protein
LKQSTSEPIRRKFDEVIFKEDEAWERIKVNLLTPRYYVFSLRGETGDSETRHHRWVYLNRNPPALKTYMEGHQRRQGKNPKKLSKRANFED